MVNEFVACGSEYTGSPGWSRKKGHKTLVVVVVKGQTVVKLSVVCHVLFDRR